MQPRKHILGGPPLHVYIIKQLHPYPQLPQLQQEIHDFYDDIYCQLLPLDNIADLELAVISPDKSIVLLLTHQLTPSTQLKSTLDSLKRRNVKVIMYPQPITTDSYYYVANSLQDIHRVIWSVKKTLGAYQSQGEIITSPITSIPTEPMENFQSNFGLPAMPLIQHQLTKINKLSVFVLKSDSKEYEQMTHALMAKYQNNPSVELRPIRTLNQFSQSGFSLGQSPILIVGDTEAAQISSQLNMFRMSSQTKIRTILHKSNDGPSLPTQSTYSLSTHNKNEIDTYISSAVVAAASFQRVDNIAQHPNSNYILKQMTGHSHASRQQIPGTRDNYNSNARTGLITSQMGDRSKQTHISSKISMKTARKRSPTPVMARGQEETMFLVLESGNEQFSLFHRSLPYNPKVITSLPPHMNFGPGRTVLMAPYEMRQHILRSTTGNPQNLGLVLFSTGPMAPDAIVKHPLVELVTDNQEDLCEYLREQNIRNQKQLSIISGMRSIINSQVSEIQVSPQVGTMVWYTQPVGPGHFFTTSSNKLGGMPQIDKEGYRKQVIKPVSILSGRGVKLRYPANIDQDINFTHSTETQIVDALDQWMREIKGQTQSKMLGEQIAMAAHHYLDDGQEGLLNHNSMNHLNRSPEIVETKVVKKTVVIEPQPQSPSSLLLPLGTQGSLLISKDEIIDDRLIQKRATARFNDNSLARQNSLSEHYNNTSGPQSWEDKESGEEQYDPYGNHDAMMGNHKLMSFRNTHQSNMQERNPSQLHMSTGTKEVPMRSGMVERTIAQAIVENLFNYKGNQTVEWHAFRDPTRTDAFRCCTNEEYIKLPPEMKILKQTSFHRPSNDTATQNSQPRNARPSSPMSSNEIPTVSKLIKRQVPLSPHSPSFPVDEINRLATRIIEGISSSNSRRFLNEAPPEAMEWHATRKNQQERYVVLKGDEYEKNQHLYIQQQVGSALPLFLQSNPQAQAVQQSPVSTTKHRRTQIHIQADERVDQKSSLKPNKPGTAMKYTNERNELFPNLNGWTVAQQAGTSQLQPYEDRLNSQISNRIDKEIPKLVHQSSRQPQNQRQVFEDFYEADPQIPATVISHHSPPPVFQRGHGISLASNTKLNKLKTQTIHQKKTQHHIEYIPERRDIHSPLRLYKPPNLQILVPPIPPEPQPHPILTDQYQVSYGRIPSSTQIDRNQFLSPPSKSYLDGSVSGSIMNKLRESRSQGEDNYLSHKYHHHPNYQPMTRSRSGKRGITNTVIEQFVSQKHAPVVAVSAGRFNVRSQDGVLTYSRKSNKHLSPQASAGLFDKKLSSMNVSSSNYRNNAMMKNFLNSPKDNTRVPTSPTSMNSWSNYNTIKDRVNSQSIQMVFRRGGNLLDEVSTGFEHPPFKIFRYSSERELFEVSSLLESQLMTVVITDQVHTNPKRIFSGFYNFNCIVVSRHNPSNSLSSRYFDFKWIAEEDSTVVIYKIRDYLNRYNYLGEALTSHGSPPSHHSNGTESVRPLDQNINVLVSEALKSKLPLESLGGHRTYLPQTFTQALDYLKTNIIIAEPLEVQLLKRHTSPHDKILVLQKQTHFQPHIPDAELTTQNPAAIVGYINSLLKESTRLKPSTTPHILYYFDEIDLEESVQRVLGRRATMAKYHDEKSLLRKVKEGSSGAMVVVLNGALAGLASDLKRIQPGIKLIGFKLGSGVSGIVGCRSVEQVVVQLQKCT